MVEFSEEVQVVTGWCYFIPCLLVLPVHVLVMAAILRIPKMRHRSALRMTFNISFCSFVQVVFINLGGLSLLLKADMNYYANQMCSIILQISWSALLILQPAFVLQRLWLVRSVHIMPEDKPAFVDPIITACWLGGMAYSVGYHMGGDDYHLDRARTTWVSTVHSAHVPIFTILFYGKMAQCGLGFFANIAVFALMVYRRRQGLDRARFKLYEVRYVLLNSIQFSMIIVDMYGYNCLPPDFIYLDQTVNFLWIAIVVLPPFLYLLFNREIRMAVFKLCGRVDGQFTSVQRVVTMAVVSSTTKPYSTSAL